MRGDRLPQGQDAQAVRVAGPPVLDRPFQRLAHHERSLEVGFPELEMHDVRAVTRERGGALTHLDGEKRLDGAPAS